LPAALISITQTTQKAQHLCDQTPGKVATTPKKEPIAKQLASGQLLPIGVLAVIFLVFLGLKIPSVLTTHPVYRSGDVAERDIKAARDFFIEDAEATETKRRQAAEAVAAVYDHDLGLAPQLTQSVTQAFAMARSILESQDAEMFGRTAPAPVSGAQATVPPVVPENSVQVPKRSAHDEIWQIKDQFENQIGTVVSNGAYRLLEENRFAPTIAEHINRLLGMILETGVVANKEMLLRESEKGIALRAVGGGGEQKVHNLKGYYGLDQAKAIARTIGQSLLKDIHYNLRNLIIDLVQQLIQPNISFNREETETRRALAATQVKPVLYMIKAGEIILREGERISEAQLLKLEALHEEIQKGRLMVSGLGAVLLLMAMVVVIYVLHLMPRSAFVRDRNRHLVFIGVVLVAGFLGTRFWAALAAALTQGMPLMLSAEAVRFGLPLAAGGMILCLFMGLEMAMPTAAVLAAGASILLESRVEWFLYFLINGALGAYWMQSCRERTVFIKAGAKLGLVNVVLAAVLNLHAGSLDAANLLWDWTFAFFGGLGSGVIAAGLAPLVEMGLGYTSDIKLLELANLDRPLLRRLMLEAPGTYHHSVIVGSMVEAAAAQIEANPLLGKVCGYYHDIGKINKPLYFIENQHDGRNRHDKLAPTMSKRILIAHVKDGAEIAHQHKLGQTIIDTIQQSAGLVMLADAVEAASRTLENPTPARIQGLVQRLINKIFSDGQLDDCELTLKDLHRIAKSFNVILNGIHHHRVEYPEKTVPGNGKSTNGSSDRQSPKGPTADPKSGPADSSGHFRRLGLS